MDEIEFTIACTKDQVRLLLNDTMNSEEYEMEWTDFNNGKAIWRGNNKNNQIPTSSIPYKEIHFEIKPFGNNMLYLNVKQGKFSGPGGLFNVIDSMGDFREIIYKIEKNLILKGLLIDQGTSRKKSRTKNKTSKSPKYDFYRKFSLYMGIFAIILGIFLTIFIYLRLSVSSYNSTPIIIVISLIYLLLPIIGTILNLFKRSIAGGIFILISGITLLPIGIIISIGAIYGITAGVHELSNKKKEK